MNAKGMYCAQGSNGTSMCYPRPSTFRCPSGDWARGECGCQATIKMTCAKPMADCLATCRNGIAQCQQCMQGHLNMCCPCLQETGIRINCT